MARPRRLQRVLDRAGHPRFWLVVALVLYSTHVWRGLTIDEYTTWGVGRLPAEELIANRLGAGHLPLYFLLMHGWMGLWGDSEVALRLPSVLAGAGAAWLFAGLAVRWLGPRWGAVASLLLVANQVIVWGSQAARPYALMLLMLMLALTAIERFWQGGRWRWLIAGGAALVAAVGVQALAALVGLGWVGGLLTRLRARPRRTALVVAALGVALVASVLPLQALGTRQANYETESQFAIPWNKALNALAHVVCGDYGLAIRGDVPKAAMWLLLLTGLSGAALAQWRRRNTAPVELPRAAMLWGWFLLIWIALTVLEGTGSKSTLGQTRYFIAALPALALLMATGLREWHGRLGRRRPRWRRVPVVCCVVVVAFATAVHLPRGGDGPHRIAARIAEPAIYAGDVDPLTYEYRRRRPPAELHSFRGVDEAAARAALGGLLRRHERVWLFIYNNKPDALDPIARRPGPDFAILKREAVGDARAVLLRRAGPP